MTRALVIASTDGGAEPIYVSANIDIIETNAFLTQASVLGTDYEAEDYVTYVETLADAVNAGRDHWSPQDVAAAKGALRAAKDAIRHRYGAELAEALTDPLWRARASNMGLLGAP